MGAVGRHVAAHEDDTQVFGISVTMTAARTTARTAATRAA
jgi:hypothetical protein